MRTALLALADELRRLKSAGVKTVAVSDASVAVLRNALAARASAAGTKPAVAKSEAERVRPPAAAAIEPQSPPMALALDPGREVGPSITDKVDAALKPTPAAPEP